MHDAREVQSTIEFGGDAHDVTVTASRRATSEEFRRLYRELVSDERFEPGMLILLECIALDLTSVTSDDLEALASFVREDGRLGSSVAAIVAPELVWFDLGPMMETLGETALRIRLFRSREDAVEWLRSVRSSRET